MENALQSYQFDASPVRVVMIAGDPWFVANDVAAVLGYRDAFNMTRNLDEDEKGTHILSTLGGHQELLIISESGLYAAIFKSRLDAARRFRKWVTAEVLPAIRREGRFELPGYEPPAALTHDHDPTKLTAYVGVVREARRLFGPKAARRVWVELGLPAAVAEAHGEHVEPLADPMKLWLEGRKEATIEEVAEGLGVLLDLDDALRMRIGAVLRTLGWFPKVKRRGHGTAKVFSPEHGEG